MNKFVAITAIVILLPAFAFADTETCFCNYQTYSDQSGNHHVKEEFTLTFVIDKEKKSAYIIGNQGSSEVMLLPSKMGGITFIEITGAGNVTSTTVDSNGMSVHSRNTVINGKLVPTQYYGTCEFK